MKRRLGSEPLLLQIRPALLYALGCAGMTGLLMIFYWLLRSERANIYVGSAFFAFGMVVGIAHSLQTRRFLYAGTLLVLAVIVTVAAVCMYGMISPSIRITLG